MKKHLSALSLLPALATALSALAAEPPPKAGSAAPPVAAPATPPAAAAPAKPPAAGGVQSSEPDRIEPTEKVRADSEISFPVDI